MQIIKTKDDLKLILHNQYMSQIKNYFGDEAESMKFLSAVIGAVQQNPKLLECTPVSLLNAFMIMAQLKLMPSSVSGEAYVIPYGKQAQFQLGYQGIVTLFFRAGGASLRSEIVRKNDKFSYENGLISHTIDIFKSNKNRGEPVGVYAIALLNNQEVCSAMNSEDVLAFGKRFSKSFGSESAPWDSKNDPELWMWKKTVLKQLAKLLPKNESIHLAISEDNKGSKLNDELQKQKRELPENNLKMGNLLKPNKPTNEEPKKEVKQEETKGNTESTKKEYEEPEPEYTGQ